tara:strand:+ start:73 stop:795 length:723 start_codon:yes stop_codon:yes gene_type:complete
VHPKYFISNFKGLIVQMKYIWIKTFAIILFTTLCIAQNNKVKVTGDYTYTYGDSETLLEAKNICYSMAIREAIESNSIFISSTSVVTHSQLNDLIQTISSGYLQELKVVEEKIEGRNVYYKVEAYVEPDVIKESIGREVKRIKSGQDYKSIVRNDIIKVLSVKKQFRFDGDQVVSVVYKQVKPYTSTEVMIDWLDSDDIPIGGEKGFSEKRLRQNEIRKIQFYIPYRAFSYRVWLHNQKE